MALRTTYEQFLAAPNPLSLTDNATFHYIPTLTSFSQPGPIVKHLDSQARTVVNKKKEKTLSAVEGESAVALEVETTLEFISGGGAYLPKLENFVVDRIATFPTTHFVQFEGDRIKTIRISWDQGSLLQQVDIVGARGKNWPITDGREQVRLIASNAAVTKTSAPPTSPRGRDTNGGGFSARDASPNKKYIKDPHTSLNLFDGQKENRKESVVAPKASARPPQRDMSELFAGGHEENRSTSSQPAFATRASARPPQREMSDLFAAGHEDYEPTPERGGSPKKMVQDSVIAPKGVGVHPKFTASRVFDDGREDNSPVGYKSNPAKYNHFSLGEEDEDDPLQHRSPQVGVKGIVPMRPKTDKHQSQWGFEDFMTPAKVAQRPQGQHARSLNWNEEDDEETPGKQKPGSRGRPDAHPNFEFQDDGPDIEKHAPVAKPRRDADTHFEMRDEYSPANHDGQGKAPLKNITNNLGRKADFGSHWNMTDDSPATKTSTNNENKPIAANRAKHNKTMSSNWDMVDDSPQQAHRPATKQNKKGLQSSWSFGDE